MALTTRGQGRILAFLKLQDGISTKELSYLLSMRVSSLNELLAKLERSGHVQREPSPKDKRVMLVKLTEKGRTEEEHDSVDISGIFDCLSADEKEVFSDHLERIISAIGEQIGFSAGDLERTRETYGYYSEIAHQHLGQPRETDKEIRHSFSPRKGVQTHEDDNDGSKGH